MENSEIMEITEEKSIEIALNPTSTQPENLNDAVVIQKTNALSMLANYNDSGSSSEEEEVNDEIPNYREKSDTEDSESSSSSSDSEEELDMKEIEKKIKESTKCDVDTDDDADDDNKTKKKRDPPKVKGEMLLSDLPPIEELQITVDEKECLEIGRISTIVEELVLVESFQNSVPLDIDSILFLDKGKKALGAIFDVIGQVSSPIYCVRFNSNEDIISKSIAVDDKVYCAPQTEYVKIVILPNIMTPGSDASWKNDIEPPDTCKDYSDDEEERKIKRQSKNKQSNSSNQDNRQFVRGRRHLPNLAYPNYSWHQNIPNVQPPPQYSQQQQQQSNQLPQQSNQYQFPNYNYWQNN